MCLLVFFRLVLVLSYIVGRDRNKKKAVNFKLFILKTVRYPGANNGSTKTH